MKLKDSTGKFAAMAQLRVADTLYQAEEPEQAIDEYRRFLEVYPSDRYAYYAQYQVAMIYFNQIKGDDRAYALAERALGEFKKLNENFPRNPFYDVTATNIAHCRDLLADHEFMVAKYDFDRGGCKGATERSLNVFEYYPENANVPEALYYIVTCNKRDGHADSAQKYYDVLKEKYSDSPYTARAAKALAAPDPKKPAKDSAAKK